MQLLWSTSYRFFFSFPANLPRFSAFTAFCFTGNSPVLGVCGFPALFAFPGASICWRKVTSSVKRIIQSGWSPNLKPHLHQPELLPPEKVQLLCRAGLHLYGKIMYAMTLQHSASHSVRADNMHILFLWSIWCMLPHERDVTHTRSQSIALRAETRLTWFMSNQFFHTVCRPYEYLPKLFLIVQAFKLKPSKPSKLFRSHLPTLRRPQRSQGPKQPNRWGGSSVDPTWLQDFMRPSVGF